MLDELIAVVAHAGQLVQEQSRPQFFYALHRERVHAALATGSHSILHDLHIDHAPHLFAGFAFHLQYLSGCVTSLRIYCACDIISDRGVSHDQER